MPHILWGSLNKSDFILCHVAREMYDLSFKSSTTLRHLDMAHQQYKHLKSRPDHVTL